MQDLAYTVHHHSGGFRYIDEGPVSDLPPVVLLHGMLGDLSNWTGSIAALASRDYRVLTPVLPVYDLPLKQTSVSGLVEYVHAFLRHLDLRKVVLVGNSLGGHVALVYSLSFPDDVSAMILSGASGIYEVTMGTGMPRRRDREFIRERAAVTFFDPAHATDELVEEMFEIINDRARVIRLIQMARSAKSELVTDHLPLVHPPTLLVWGKDDIITPPDVAEEFLRRMPNATLHFIDRCGHAPMIEHPAIFNRLMLAFLERTVGRMEFAMPTGT